MDTTQTGQPKFKQAGNGRWPGAEDDGHQSNGHGANGDGPADEGGYKTRRQVRDEEQDAAEAEIQDEFTDEIKTLRQQIRQLEAQHQEKTSEYSTAVIRLQELLSRRQQKNDPGFSTIERMEALHRLEAQHWAKAELANTGWTPPALLDQDDIEKLPDPVPLIKGVLDLGTVGELTGYTGTAKSFLGLDWGLSVAHGVPWMEHDAAQGHVLYVAAEDGAGLKFRTRAWHEHRDVKGKGKITYCIQAVNLAIDAQVDWLIKVVQDRSALFVMLDTYDKCSIGAEENSSTDTARIVANLYRISNANGPNSVTVLVIHHTGYDKKRGRGSSGLPSGIDFVFNMESDDPHEYTELKAVKRKDAQLPPAAGFRLRQVQVEGGTSCVLQKVTVAPVKPDAKAAQRAENEEKIRQAREKHPDATQADIARATGLSTTTVGRYWK